MPVVKPRESKERATLDFIDLERALMYRKLLGTRVNLGFGFRCGEGPPAELHVGYIEVTNMRNVRKVRFDTISYLLQGFTVTVFVGT